MISLNIPKTVTTLYPPTVATILSKRYAIYSGGPESNWYEVPEDFTLQDANKRWKRLVSANVAQPSAKKAFKVANSKGNGFYDVVFDGKLWSCSCTGFGFRRDCKHVQQTKKQYK